MEPLSRRSLQILCFSGFALAAAGWVTAWKNGRALTEVRQEFGVAEGGLQKTSSRGARQAGASDHLVSDPRTAHLVELMQGFDASSIRGKANPEYLKAFNLTLGDSLFHRRQRDFRLLMEKMRPEDAVALHERFFELEREGRPFAEEYAAFAMRWGQIDPEGAFAYLSEHSENFFQNKEHDIINLLNGWGTTDPEKALAWVEANQVNLSSMNAYRPVLVGWLNSDSVAATAWLQNQNFGQGLTNDCVNGAMLDKIYSDGLENAAAWLADLPGGNATLQQAALSGWRDNLNRMQNLDPAQAAGIWSKIGSQEWMPPVEFMRFTSMVANANQGDLEQFTEALGKQWSPTEAGKQFEHWAAADPGAVAAIAQRLPASPIRAAMEQAVGGKQDRLLLQPR